jgi:hypothetical protein
MRSQNKFNKIDCKTKNTNKQPKTIDNPLILNYIFANQKHADMSTSKNNAGYYGYDSQNSQHSFIATAN